ncbi:hypothetical protein JOD24_002573 [Kroppenstedtia sanguinis]
MPDSKCMKVASEKAPLPAEGGRGGEKRFKFSGVLISHILGGEIMFYHATVAIRQGSEIWPLQI